MQFIYLILEYLQIVFDILKPFCLVYFGAHYDTHRGSNMNLVAYAYLTVNTPIAPCEFIGIPTAFY